MNELNDKFELRIIGGESDMRTNNQRYLLCCKALREIFNENHDIKSDALLEKLLREKVKLVGINYRQAITRAKREGIISFTRGALNPDILKESASKKFRESQKISIEPNIENKILKNSNEKSIKGYYKIPVKNRFSEAPKIAINGVAKTKEQRKKNPTTLIIAKDARDVGTR